MYMSSLRHTHDPVLSSLKMKGIRFFLLIRYTKLLSGFAIRHPGQRQVPLLVILYYIYRQINFENILAWRKPKHVTMILSLQNLSCFNNIY
jgi:hypothetical protein